ncbi:MAG: hypothetical protein KC445_17450, partial [Anaerolineales bacterium]|nr:hypothetical protein [Anaerolineales bacterium]
NYGSVVMGNAQFVLDPDAGYPGAGLVQLDVSDPLRPVETAVIDERSNTLHRVGSYVITTGNNLQTFTLNDAGLLEQVAVCEDCYAGGVNKIVAAGLDILHLIGPDGISIVAVPGGPDFVYYDFFATDFPLLDGVTEALRNATYYVGTTCSGTDLDCTESTLLTLNTGVAHEPEVTSRLIIPGNARKLVMFDGLLWVMTVDGRFIPHILTDPFAPQMLNKGIQLPLRSTLVQTEVIGDRLFISHPDTGILVYQMAEE